MNSSNIRNIIVKVTLILSIIILFFNASVMSMPAQSSSSQESNDEIRQVDAFINNYQNASLAVFYVAFNELPPVIAQMVKAKASTIGGNMLQLMRMMVALNVWIGQLESSGLIIVDVLRNCKQKTSQLPQVFDAIVFLINQGVIKLDNRVKLQFNEYLASISVKSFDKPDMEIVKHMRLLEALRSKPNVQDTLDQCFTLSSLLYKQLINEITRDRGNVSLPDHVIEDIIAYQIAKEIDQKGNPFVNNYYQKVQRRQREQEEALRFQPIQKAYDILKDRYDFT